MQNTGDVKSEILAAATVLFNDQGLKFTMDDLAVKVHRSKKTIYALFPDKEALLNAMVDSIFDSIKESEQSHFSDKQSDTVARLKNVLGAMPDQYQNVDFGKLFVLKEKYPQVYARVEERLETGWETTILILEEGMENGTFRRFSIPVFKTMMQATLEQFFQREVLVENGISYNRALNEVVGILVDGICIHS